VATFLISGYYGAGNLGDEAILECMLKQFREIDPKVNYIVTSWDPAVTSNRYQVESVPWKDFGSVFNAVKRANLVILGGGGLFQDYWGINPATYLSKEYWGITAYGTIPLLARLNNIPSMCYAVGLGPFFSEEGVQHTRFALENCDRVTLRDQDSLSLLSSAGFNSLQDVKVFADPAFTLSSSPDEEIEVEKFLQPYRQEGINHFLGLILRNWDHSSPQSEWVQNLAEVLRQFSFHHPDYRIIFIPFQVSEESKFTNDLVALNDLSDALDLPKKVILVDSPLTPGKAQSLIANCDAVISMRLHGLIMAINTGTPLVGLPYDPKVSSLLKEAGLSEYCSPSLTVDQAKFVDLVEQVIARKIQIRKAMKKFHADAEKAAYKNALQAFDLYNNSHIQALSIQQQIQLEQTWSLNTKSAAIESQAARISELTEQNKQITQETQQLNDRLNAAKADIFHLNTLQEEQASQLQQLQITIHESNLTRQLLEKQTIEMQKKYRHEQKEKKQFRKSLEDLQSEFLQVQQERIQLQERVETLGQELTSIYSSRSWKLNRAYYILMDKPFFRFLRRPFAHQSNLSTRRFNLWNRILSKTRLVIEKLKAAWLNPPKFFQDTFVFDGAPPVIRFSSQELIHSNQPTDKQIASRSPAPLKISLISCLKNESGNIDKWFERIFNQTLPPDEIILVDNGSTDGSLERLEYYASLSSIPIRILSEPAGNIAHNRNLAISHASYPVIAATDFGCFARPDWLEKITEPFRIDPEIQVSAGIYAPINKEPRQPLRNKHLWLWATPEKIDPASYLPPGGSMAFKKESWEAVGGYPEWLTLTGEDTYFDLALKFFGGKWAYVPEAVVEWIAPSNFFHYLKKLYRWAIGDGETGIHARYYWVYLPRTVGWATLTGLCLITAILLIFLSQSWLAAGSVVLFYLLVNLFIALSIHLSPRLFIQRVTGEAAQLAGFIRGAKNRRIVDSRRSKTLSGVIFMLAGVPFDDTGGGSRGAQITQELLRKGYAVIYLNYFPKYESRELNIQFFHPNLYRFSLNEFHWETFQKEHTELLNHPNLASILEFPLPEFLPIAEKIKERGGQVLYDLIDDWRTSLGGSWYSPKYEKQVVDFCSAFTATAPTLQDHLQQLSKKTVTLVPNAVNHHLFDPRISHSRPADLPSYKRVMLYSGALWGEWFNWDLLEKIAKQYPDQLVCVIGDFRGQFISSCENLKFLGLKPQTSLPAYLAFADVTIIPWKVNQITLSTSPLKIYEYLAMHCPVIAPNIAPLRSIPGVWLAEDEDDFIRLAGRIDRSKIDLRQIDTYIKNNNWSTRVDQMLSDIFKVQEQ
jgi:polysaccharide pyruvyl transferase CsaB